ncbi:hypothetical protein [Thermofilum pendens]|nr:hypothetical protein [Thermofilum pendens]
MAARRTLDAVDILPMDTLLLRTILLCILPNALLPGAVRVLAG